MDLGKPGTFVPGRGEKREPGTGNRPRGSKRFVLLDLYGSETRSTGYISDTHNSHHDMLAAIKETRCLYCLNVCWKKIGTNIPSLLSSFA